MIIYSKVSTSAPDMKNKGKGKSGKRLRGEFAQEVEFVPVTSARHGKQIKARPVEHKPSPVKQKLKLKRSPTPSISASLDFPVKKAKRDRGKVKY
jgi:hypothetical protein